MTAQRSASAAANWLPWITAGLAHPDPLKVLPVLAGVRQLVASIMAQPAKLPVTDDPQAKMMRSMVYYVPPITVFIAGACLPGSASGG